MSQRQLPECPFPPARDFQQYLPAVAIALEFPHEATGCETIGQFHSTVMAKMEPLREIADGWQNAFRQSLESQQ